MLILLKMFEIKVKFTLHNHIGTNNPGCGNVN